MRCAVVLTLALCACSTAAVDPRQVLSREAIDRSDQPLLLAELPIRGVAASLVQVGDRSGVDTWQTAQGQTLSYRRGVLVATRGLGDDLMSADVGGTLAALSGGPRSDYLRLVTFLDGEGRTVFRAMQCEMGAPSSATVRSFSVDFATSLRVETCHTSGLSVENRYWLDPSGEMRRSEQWVSPTLGSLATELVTR